eukprot:scaffold1686_cov30-Phaeocystis_antarctica.AAC.1
MEPSLPQRQRSSALCPEWPEAAKKSQGFLQVIRRPRFVPNWWGVGNAVHTASSGDSGDGGGGQLSGVEVVERPNIVTRVTGKGNRRGRRR